MADRTPRTRRQRSVTASLASIVLAVELVVVLLAALVLFGLHSLPPAVALGGGGALIAVIVVAAALPAAGRPSAVRAGVALGWVVQVALISAIVVDLTVGVVGLLFAALWTYSMIVGRRIDRRTPPAT